MDPFELRRVVLLHSPSTDKTRQWFLLNVKICGVRGSKFLSSSLLVASFPSEFFTVQLSVQFGWSINDRIQDIASPDLELFLPSVSEGEVAKYRWLIDAINSLEIGTETGQIRPASSDAFREELNWRLVMPPQLSKRKTIDWTLLHFKLQSRILDQAWQTLLSISKLGRAGVSHNVYIFIEIRKSALCYILL